MRCLLCEKEMNTDFYDLFLSEDCICQNCRSMWERKDVHFKISGISGYAPYVYNQAYAGCLVQFKECGDEALKDVFFTKVRKRLKRKYSGYTLLLMPSSKRKREARGFDHLKEMYGSLGLDMMSPFLMKEERDQKNRSAAERRKMADNIALPDNIVLPRKIVLADDTVTTGSTLKGALSCLDREKHDIRILCGSCNRRFVKGGVS